MSDRASERVHADAAATLSAWRPADRGQESLRHAFLGFLAARSDSCQRSCVPGHITASAIVLDAAGEHVLLTLHPRVGAWLQLGGHCEASDTTLAGAALREATEESGISGLRIEPTPAHLDVHPITCSLGVPTRHFDVRFVVRAPPGARPIRSTESIDLRWWPLNALPPDSTGTTGIAAMLAAANLEPPHSGRCRVPNAGERLLERQLGFVDKVSRRDDRATPGSSSASTSTEPPWSRSNRRN